MTTRVSGVGFNTTTTALGSSQTFTGGWERVANDEAVAVSVAASADGTLYVDQSPDGTNTDSTLTYSVTGGVNEVHRLVVTREYYRVRLVNGSVAQTYLRLQCKIGSFGLLSAPFNLAVQQDADAIVTKGISDELLIAGGLLSGYSIVNKFGTNADIDTGTVPEDIWEGGGAYTGFPDSTLETVEVLSSNSADNGATATGALTIRITGLDGDYNVQSETITLNGTTPVASVNTYRRVHTASVQTAGSGGVNAGTITVRHSTTEANVFLSMVAGRNQTNCSGYTVPAGYTAYMRHITVAIRGTSGSPVSGTVAAEGNLWTRSFGGVFRSRRPFVSSNNFPLEDNIYGGLVFTEKSDIILRITAVSASDTSVVGGYDLVLVRN